MQAALLEYHTDRSIRVSSDPAKTRPFATALHAAKGWPL